MVKREVLEIKKQFKPSECTISRLCTCYVDGEKNVKAVTTDAFLSLPEEDCFKYFEIFRKALSGSLGKSLINLDFPLESEKEGGAQEFLLRLRDSGLKDEELKEEFYQKVIENFDYVGNYVILLADSTYDIPVKTLDGLTMDDASDEVYHYILCCICPVELSKPGLSYDEKKARFENRFRDWVVRMPETAFLFPAFNDRSADIHSCLYYAKDGKDLHHPFVEGVLACPLPLAAEEQKISFQGIITDTLGESCDYRTVMTIHENLNELLEESKDAEEPLVLNKEQIRDLFEKSGVDAETMEKFDENFNQSIGEKCELVATNVTAKTFQVKMPSVVIKVDPEMAHLVETKEIDGRKCLVVAIEGGVEVNGIVIKDEETE